MKDFIAKTNQLNDLESAGYLFAFIGLIASIGFIFFESLQMILLGNFFLVEGINPALIHLGTASSLLCLTVGVCLMLYVDKTIENI
jgi:hypothetical protein